MEETGKLAMLKSLLGEDAPADDGLLSAYLTLAGDKLRAVALPYAPEAPLPEQYSVLQVEAALFLFNKRGAEGQISHSENGISRSYESADLPGSLLRQITPKVGVM